MAESAIKLVSVLPDFAAELTRGLIELGDQDLARAVGEVMIVTRCRCREPGCVTFHAVPEEERLRWPYCDREIPPVRGVSCLFHHAGKILWLEALGRPDDRARLDKYYAEHSANSRDAKE